MDFFSITSGSSGNCICVGDDNTHVMIDAGISGKRIEAGMNKYDYTTADMNGLLVTHEHSDHVSGLGVEHSRFLCNIALTASDLASITSHIHSWALFLLWLHPFILSGVISPLISSSILGTY